MRKYKKLFITLLILLISFSVTACEQIASLEIGFPEGFVSTYSGNNKKHIDEYLDGTTYIEAIDIGQGDAFLISNNDFGNILVDAGDTKNNMDVYLVDYLKEKGIKKLDAIIISHPHMDHIGGMSRVLDNFEVANVYMPRIKTSTKTYKNMLKKIKSKGLLIDEAKEGVQIKLSKGNSIKFISPCKDTNKEDLNDYSSVFVLNSYGKKTLFTGDISTKIERKVAKKVGDIDILKVSHHGSRSASKTRELKTLKPEYAIVSLGKDNKYGHPAKEVLTNLRKAGAEIYRTDKDGHIVAIIDSKGEVEITTSK